MNKECCNHDCNQGRDCPKRNKELTKKEISNIRDEFLTPKDCDIYTFDRAILRKAQENDII